MSSINKSQVTGVILAGGKGRRFDGLDKGLIPFKGKPMVEWLIEILDAQVGALSISANRSLEAYQAYGYPVISDRIPGFIGPLAGLHAALSHIQTPWLLVAPCDSPFIPNDFAERLLAVADENTHPLVVATEGKQSHYLHALMHISLLSPLQQWLDEGGSPAVRDWYQSLNPVGVDFSDTPGVFANINSPEELTHFISNS